MTGGEYDTLERRILRLLGGQVCAGSINGLQSLARETWCEVDPCRRALVSPFGYYNTTTTTTLISQWLTLLPRLCKYLRACPWRVSLQRF